MRSILTGLLAGIFLLPVQAQTDDTQIPDGGSQRRYAPKIERDPTVNLTMPADVPAVPAANAMTTFLVPDLSDRQTFAFDPASFRLEGTVLMVTLTATSSSGAKTSGYYAFNCDNYQYRLLGFPSKGKWKASSRTKWRAVLGIKRRPSQFVPLYAAGCTPDGKPVSSAKELARRMLEHNPNTD